MDGHLMEADSSTSSNAPTLEAWLEEHGELERACATGLLSLVEPFGAFVGIKAVGTGRYVFASAGLAALFECAEIVGRTDAELLKAEETSGLRRAEQTAMAQRTVLINEHRLDVRGRKREFSVTRCALGEGYLLAIWQDRTEDKLREGQLARALTQIEELQEQLESLRREMQSGSGRDDVSGLYLRAQFDDSLRREIDLSQREHREFALVIISLDPPPQGAMDDAVEQRMLEGLGRMLRANTRAMDAACRVDERHFALLLSGVGLATAHARMEQLRRQCNAQLVVFHGVDVGLSVSMGVSSFPHTASGHTELMQASESAVAEAQRRGGNQVVLAPIPFA
jgi:diguanylate cyclase (GGDEF)-like protein